ncbi:MAG: TldD/PmbA family protein [Candidatus Thermoplasmatota archaeon]|nr:TldD/PmbA family protein [Candidatus Thermoplasmatota archaeon]
MEFNENILKILRKKDLSEYVVATSVTDTDQVRFSADSKDLFNHWSEKSAAIFISRGKKIFSTTISNVEMPEHEIDKAVSILNTLPENTNYMGISDKKHSYGSLRKFKKINADIDEMASTVLNSALNAGSDRVAGLVYNEFSTIYLDTQINEVEYSEGGLHILVRSFIGEGTGQESSHLGFDSKSTSKDLEKMGREASETAKLGSKFSEGKPGKYDVLMSPYLVGNLITYGSSLFSAYNVDAGMSCFENKVGQKVASGIVNLIDDPLNFKGDAAVQVDEEATPTKRLQMIENGVLKTYLHSTSTARKFGAETTGNAGIISPHPWQLNMLPGKESFDSILQEMKKGLYVRNAWYTRFQDYRNGIFSTVPRDGIFTVEDGEITGSIRGIRISDEIPRILMNIDQVSKEQMNVKWWQEIHSSFMPYVHVRDVSISKSF